MSNQNPFDTTQTYGSGGSYLKPSDLGNSRHDVTISEVTLEPNFEKTGNVIVLAFQGREKKLTLNKTRAQACVLLADGKTDARQWVGMTITLEPGMTKKLDGTPTPTIVVSMIRPNQVPFTPQAASAPQQTVSADDIPF